MGLVGLIYVITNQLNGKQYVGQTTQPLAQRWQTHQCMARNKRNQYPIARALRKYGPHNFTIKVLQECPNSKLDEREKAWILKLKTYGTTRGYNATPGGQRTARQASRKMRLLYKLLGL